MRILLYEDGYMLIAASGAQMAGPYPNLGKLHAAYPAARSAPVSDSRKRAAEANAEGEGKA